jgi:hypothetical protein
VNQAAWLAFAINPNLQDERLPQVAGVCKGVGGLARQAEAPQVSRRQGEQQPQQVLVRQGRQGAQACD